MVLVLQAQEAPLIRINKLSLDPADSGIYRASRRRVDGVEGIVDCDIK